MGVSRPPSIPTSGAQRTSCIGRRRLGSLQVPSRAPLGEPRPPSPTRRPASLGEAAEADRSRPYGQGVAGTAGGAPAKDGASRGGSGGRRTAPSLPTTGSVRSAVPLSSSGIGASRGLCLTVRTRQPARRSAFDGWLRLRTYPLPASSTGVTAGLRPPRPVLSRRLAWMGFPIGTGG